MFAAALIVFREVLEAALVVSIIMAATKGIARRGYWISTGIVGGLLGAGLVAAFTSYLSTLFEGSGQDIVNAGILSLAVVLISWHVVWMNSHGKHIAVEMRKAGRSVANGEKHMSVLALVVGIAVMREGSEIVLMLQGLWTIGSTQAMLGGGALWPDCRCPDGCVDVFWVCSVADRAHVRADQCVSGTYRRRYGRACC